MTLSTTVSTTELRTALDAKTASITANKKAGQKDIEHPLRLNNLAAGAHLLTRSIAWTQQDDAELRALFLRVDDTVASRVVVATLEVDDGETKFLVDNDVTATATTIVGTADGRTDFRTTTGKRMKLLSGVRYRLSVENTTPATTTGVVMCGIQTRSVRRGGAGGPALVPNRLRVGGNLDVDKINDNLQQIADDIEDSVDQRFTHGRFFFKLDGITDTDAAVLRQFVIRRPDANSAVHVEFVELVGTNVDTGATWTLSKVNDSAWPTISIDGGGASVEVYDSTDVSASIASDAADTAWQLTAGTSSGKKINAGYLVFHTRCDRNDQGDTNEGYDPTLFDARSSTAAATMQAQIDAIAAAVTADAAANKDMRCECYAVRNIAAGASERFDIPGGARSEMRIDVYAVSAATVTTRVTYDNGVDPTTTIDVVGAGVAAWAYGGADLTGAPRTNPMTSVDDTALRIKNNAGAADVLLAFVLLWLK